MIWRKILYSALILCSVCGNAILRALPESKEIQMGIEEFAPLVQEEGGADVIHPLLSRYVKRVGKKLAAVSDRPNLPYEFVILDNTTLNAWALSGGKIGINLGLLMQLTSEAELAYVLAHEIGHAAAGHIATQVEREAVLGVLKAGIHQVLKSYWYAPLLDQGASVGEELTLLRYNRQDELEADALAIKYMAKAGYDVQAAITVEELFLKLDASKQEGWVTKLFATHPPSKERLKADKKTASKYDTGGFQGKAEYAEVIEPVCAKTRAYRALDKGRLYLSKGKIKKALVSAQKGLAIEPNEPHLSLLEAQALLHLGRSGSALTSINRAIKINPHYFEYYLERSLIYEKLGNTQAAKSDRAIAEQLLPDLETHKTSSKIVSFPFSY